MTIEQKFKKLDEVSHVLKRPGRYIGNINTISSESYILKNDKFEVSTISWCPALLKIFDEIISNSVDHAKTDAGKLLDTIKVSVDRDTGEISVYDNGGIVVLKHKEYDQYIPEMIFELRAGSNFNDETEESTRMGTHGEGAALTCIFSKSFNVETADGKNKFIQKHTDNSRTKTVPTIKKCKDNYTIIKYLPDYEKFNMVGLSEDDYKKLEKRVYDIAGCNPKLKVYFNDKKINIKSFQDYIKLYTDECIFDHNKSWEVGVSKSDGSFSHVSFVNSTETLVGGTHVNYIADQIILKLREYIEKKHKITIKPSEIKNHLNIFINSSIVNPRFNGQTKEEMISDVKTFGSTFEISDNFIKHIVQSSIVQSILDWAAAKEQALLMAELKKLNKKSEKADPSRILKFEDCAEKKFRDKCTLFITEGDCLEESQLLLVYKDNKLSSTQIKDVNIGDYVLTHNNRLKPVISKQEKVIEGIRLSYNNESLIISPEHKLVVYDKTIKSFIDVMGKDLDKTRHQLVKSRIVDIDHLDRITRIEMIDGEYSLHIFTENDEEGIMCTDTHKFYVWDERLAQFSLTEAQYLNDTHSMVMKGI